MIQIYKIVIYNGTIKMKEERENERHKEKTFKIMDVATAYDLWEFCGSKWQYDNRTGIVVYRQVKWQNLSGEA